jgi:hypothetical protein
MKKGYAPPSYFREWLTTVFSPTMWGSMHEYNPEWDHYVRVAIQLGMVKPYYITPQDVSYHRVMIGSTETWVGNYPYGYGSHPELGRPSYKTIRMLRLVVTRVMLHAEGTTK